MSDDSTRPHSNRWKLKRTFDILYWCGHKLGWQPGKHKTMRLAEAGTLLASLPNCHEDGYYKLIELKGDK